MTTAATDTGKSQILPPGQAAEQEQYAPMTDVTETDDAFVFEAEMPGVKPGEVEASFDDGVLTIHGNVALRQPPQQQYALQEYGVAAFHRSFVIDVPVAPERITAQLRDGLLTVTVPKAESARRRKIEIKVS